MAHHVCPWWLGYVLASPVRRILQSPERLLRDHLRVGMTVLDIGCAMGFFSLPAARMVGPTGRVICVDLQQRMLASLDRRARRAGLADRIESRLCQADSLGLGDLAGTIDLALALYVIHETPDASRALGELEAALAPGGRVLLAEPRGHVGPPEWEATLEAAAGAGLVPVDRLSIRRSHGALLARRSS